MLPLHGVRILAVEQYGAGPVGTLHLASLGAEIIKIESPRDGGDVSRAVGPHFVEGADRSVASLFFQSLNHNKKSMTLDLGAPEGQAVLHRLVGGADAVVSNLRGDVPARLGITYEQLQEHNPRLVCAHLTAYGRGGSRASWPGYDYMMQAEAGYFALTGEPEAPPARFGLSIVDFMTGMALALGVSAALYAVRGTGIGRNVDVNLFDVALHNLNYVASWFLNAGVESERAPRSAHLSLVPCQLYRTRDGFIYLMCNKEKFWAALCQAVGRPDLQSDPRFRDYAARLRNRDELTAVLDEVLMQADTAVWMAKFSRNVPAAPVYSVAEALENPYVREAGRVIDVPVAVPAGAPSGVRLVKPPIDCGVPQPAPTAAPLLGEQTDDILRSLGYDSQAIGVMRSRGIV